MPLFVFRPPKKPLSFMKWRFIAFAVSAIVLIATIASLSTQGLALGVDFTGGTVAEVRSEQTIDVATLREQLAGAGFTDASIQGFDQGMGATIRLPAEENPEVSAQTISRLSAALPEGVRVEGTSALGPKVSGEFLQKAMIAVGLSILSIGIYVWIRFEFKFGLAAFLTTLHDAILVFGLFTFTRMTFDMTVVAGILTVIGYSINDTVVVYDRIRENLRKYKTTSLSDLIDLSVTETLPRTIVTGGTTLLTSAALLVLGGPVLAGFAAAITFGVIIGTFSSIFVAAPLLLHLPGRLPTEHARGEKANSTEASPA